MVFGASAVAESTSGVDAGETGVGAGDDDATTGWLGDGATAGVDVCAIGAALVAGAVGVMIGATGLLGSYVLKNSHQAGSTDSLSAKYC
jgi:hypothetical protein